MCKPFGVCVCFCVCKRVDWLLKSSNLSVCLTVVSFYVENTFSHESTKLQTTGMIWFSLNKTIHLLIVFYIINPLTPPCTVLET